MEIPLKQLKGLLKTLEDGGVDEFEYQDEKYRVRIAFGRSAASVATPMMVAAHAAPSMVPPGATPAATDPQQDDPDAVYVTSPFVGTFYRASAPDAEPFVQIGAQVTKGQTLCIVEAMKLMNEIEAEQAGTVLEALVENGDSVEFGQKLFKLRKG